MLKKGDIVCYGQSGVCKVEGQIEKEILGKVQEYFVLGPLNKAGSVVYIPCENKELVGKMRKPLTPSQIEEALSCAAGSQTEWNRDFRKRSDAFKKALSSSDCMDSLLLIKTIYDHRREEQKNDRRIHTTDDYFLRDAENLVYSEFSYVLQKDYEEIAQRVRDLFNTEE